MKHCLFLFLLVIPFYSFSQTQVGGTRPDTEYYNDGNISVTRVFDKASNKKIETEYYLGNKIASIRMLDTPYEYEGIQLIFFKNGNIFYFCNWSKSNLYGPFAEYYESGQLKRNGYYYNSFMTGEWTEYYANGNKKSSGEYVMSKEDSANKDLIRERVCYDTLEYGVDDIYTFTSQVDKNDSGAFEVTMDTLFRKDIRLTLSSPKNGTWQYWDQNGILISEEWYKKGVLIKRRKYKK